MRRLFVTACSIGCILFFTGCEPAGPVKVDRNVSNNKDSAVATVGASSVAGTPAEGVGMLGSDTLLPLARLQPGNKDIFREYGIEFLGTCYECDLATIRITKSTIEFVNVCDPKVKLQLAIEQLNSASDTVNVNAGQWLFSFVKLNDAPVYKLNVFSERFKKRNLRLSRFFTFKKMQKKFFVHDCGEFDG